MLKDNALTADSSKLNSLLSVFSSSPITSSCTVGWSDIQLAHFRQPPHNLPEYSSPYHVVCINLGGLVVLERLINGRFRIFYSNRGEIGLYPANLEHSVRWDREAEFLQLYLEPTLLRHISYELCGSARIELVSQSTFRDPLILYIGLALKTALETDGLGSRLYAESMANALVNHLLSRYSKQERAIRQYTGGLSRQNLEQVVDYINEHLDQNLSLADLAAVVKLSSSRFAHLFKQSMGISPHQYFIRCRVERAKQLLLSRDLTIAEVAHSVGFASQGHLTSHFKRLVGITPKRFLLQ
jgi:AraC family transcriptional regulator